MGFSNSVLPFPPQTLDPANCHAVRIGAIFEMREQSEIKQKAYEQKRREWRKFVGSIDTK
jgi:hypothetical protein